MKPRLSFLLSHSSLLILTRRLPGPPPPPPPVRNQPIDSGPRTEQEEGKQAARNSLRTQSAQIRLQRRDEGEAEWESRARGSARRGSIKEYEMGKIVSRTDSKLSKGSGEAKLLGEEEMETMPEDVEVEIV